MSLEATRLLRTIARQLVGCLSDEQGQQLTTTPGHVFFPKTLTELEARDPTVPDGNSVAYIELVESLQKYAPVPEHALASLIDEIRREVALATRLEKQLLESRLTGE